MKSHRRKQVEVRLLWGRSKAFCIACVEESESIILRMKVESKKIESMKRIQDGWELRLD